MSHYRSLRSHANCQRLSHLFRRATTLMLVVMMLSAQTPAAPQVISGAAVNWQLGATLWLESSGWAARLNGLFSGQRAPEAKAQEQQSKRDARVSRIQIYPGDVETAEGERVQFTAVAYDRNGAQVAGVDFRWHGQDEGRGRGAHLRPTGEFVARIEGNFKVTVEGAGRSAHVSVRVGRGTARRSNEQPIKLKNISTSDTPASDQAAAPAAKRTKQQPTRSRPARSGTFVKASFAPTASVTTTAAVFLPPNDEYGWNSDNYMYTRDPNNERGERPGRPIDDGAGSGNFQVVAPLLSLAGRGSNVSLGLAYNSRVWTKAGNIITFDADRDWPAPGWSLGFGKIVGMGTAGSLIIDPDGTRHGFSSDSLIYYPSSGEVNFTGHTNDSSFTNYSTYSNNNGIRWASARLSNGSTVEYGAPGNNAVYPTRITDPNGNYIVVSYRNNAGPQINVVTDTLGRTIKFHYDSNNLLTALTAPGFDGGAARTLVRLHYQQKTLEYNNFNLTTRVRFPDNVVWLVDAIYYPATGTGYWFGDANSYSSYGMLAKVTDQRSMSFSGASPSDTVPTEMGTVTQGVMTRQQSYNYPLTPNPNVYLADAPTYDTMTERWVKDDSGDSQAIVETNTTYTVEKSATNPSFPTIPSRKTTLTRGSDGLKSIQYSYDYTTLAATDPNKFKDGLIYQDETRDADGNLLQSSTVTEWQQGAYESPRPLRTEVIDERGQKTATEFSYGPAYNQVTEVRDYDYGGTSLLRVTKTEYENGAGYIGRHIFNLIRKVETFAADGTTRLSLVEYEYDGAASSGTPDGSASLVNLPTAVVQHEKSHNPWAPQYMVDPGCRCEYNGYGDCVTICDPPYPSSDYLQTTDYRGNITKITRYADAAAAGGAMVETRAYDITGNLRTASTSCCEQTTVGYTSGTQYAYPASQTRGAASEPTKQISTSAVYDFNTGLITNITNANGRIAQTVYDPARLRPQTVYAPKAVPSAASAYTSYAYDEAAMSVTETIYTSSNQVAAQNVKRLNGNGQVRREESKAVGTNAWDVVETQYDDQGRVWRQSAPFRAGSGQPLWTTTHYDVMGRVKKVEAPDGSVTETFYNEDNYPASATQNAPGHTVRARDAWGRERWGRTDVNGRLVEVVEPNPLGGGSVSAAGSLLTTYSYDAAGNVIGTTQGSQTRSFRYDSLGRLTRQKLAEASATIDDAGNYVGVGALGAQWSDAFTYDERSNLVSRTDARGVVTAFSYRDAGNNLDPLNRLQSVSYTSPVNSNIAAVPGLTYTYEPGGDKTRIKTVVTAGVSTETYEYDSESRGSARELRLDGRTAYPFRIDYTFDSLDRITDIAYPAQYGVVNTPRKVVHHDYDAAGRLSELKVGGASYASQIDYNAASQTTSLKVGGGTNQLTESYDYDPLTGTLEGQQVYRGSETPANTLLDLSYQFLRAGTTTGRVGQLTALTDNRDPKKDRSYEYDALGRLMRASAGGTGGSWRQNYLYDRYGNRSNVLSSRTDQFVSNLFYVLLNQTPSGADLQAKDEVLRQAYGQGQPQLLNAARNMVAGFLNSPEYAARNRSDLDYVSDLYQAYFNRAPDQAGATGWTAAVATQGRLAVRQAFADSPEFANRVNGMYPGATSATNAPAGLMVTNAAPTGVSLSWTAPSGAVAHYRVERRQSGSTAYTVIANPATNSFTDAAVSGNAAYLYRVRAVDANGYASPDSNVALGAAVTFADDPIVSGGTQIKAQHLAELRQAVNAVRQLAGLAQATWAEPVAAGGLIRASHVQELRDRLGEALAALNLPAGAFTDASLATGAQGTTLKKEHVAELRARASRVSGAAGGGMTAIAPVEMDGWVDLSFDAATNRINSAGWEYDDAGNQTRARVGANTWQRYEYDAANRLVRVRADDAAQTVLASYTYGDTNQRLVSAEGGTRTYYAAEGGQVLNEYTEAGTGAVPQWAKSYVYMGARLLATSTPGLSGEVVQYTHPDRLGTRLVTNAANADSFEQATLPFGTALASESAGATGRRFTSYDRSNVTGLDYAINRQYDSRQGRFTQVDPIGMRAASLEHPQTLNLYSYCGNDPVNRTDPDGQFFGFFKKLFRSIGRIFSAVGTALSRVLNNRWVRIAVFALDFILPGLGSLTKVLTTALKIYNKIADITSLLQLGGALLLGRFREFGIAVGLGIVSGLITQVTSAIKNGIKDALFTQKYGGFDELADLFRGAWDGFTLGLKTLGLTLKHAFEDFPKNFVPWHGIYCSPAATGSNVAGTGINNYDDTVCRPHDMEQQNKSGTKEQINQRRFKADLGFVGNAIFGGAPNVTSFDIAFSGQFGGRPLIGSVHKFFSIPIFTVSATYRFFTPRDTR